LQLVETPDIVGEQVVLGDAPVLGPRSLDDVEVVKVLEGRAVPRLAVAPVGGALGLDHVERHPQADHTVGHTSATRDLAVGMLHDDLVAEVPRRIAAGVGNQGLFGGKFQLELVTQEP
jgi:hypothetical protein